MKNLKFLLALSVPMVLAGCHKSQYTAYALTSTQQILQFDTKSPDKITSTLTLTLPTNKEVQTIFFSTSDGGLYCTTSDNFLCSIDLSSGAVTVLGDTANNLFSLTNYGSDTLSSIVAGFDPSNDLVRIFASDTTVNTNTDNLNLQFSGLESNTIVATQKATYSGLVFANGDTNQNKNPQLVAVAYDSTFSGATSTTLYGLDSKTQSLVRIGDSADTGTTSVDNGAVHTIGTLSVSVSGTVGFAIEGQQGDAFVAMGGNSTLYTIDLGNGAMTSVGEIGSGYTVWSLAFDPSQ